MRIVNIGSINVDHVYEVDHFVRPGETLNSKGYQTFAGGKGFNQSIALSRAGAAPLHAGKVGKDAGWLLKRLQQEGVDTTHVAMCEATTGHAVIQVTPNGENAIVLCGGANRLVTQADVAAVLTSCSAGDVLLIQNETSAVAQAIQHAHEIGMRIVFNPAPMTSDVCHYPLGLVDIFVLNEIEAEILTGKTNLSDLSECMRQRFPNAATVLTLGGRGAMYFDANSMYRQAAYLVEVADTTAAGDTFIGYFLAELLLSGRRPPIFSSTGL